MATIFQQGDKPQVRVTFGNKDGKNTVSNIIVIYETEKQVVELMKLAKEKLETWGGITE